MTVHNSSDALTAEMLSIGAAARDAARAMREAGDAAKTKALQAAAAAIRSRAADILAANKADVEAATAANMAAPMSGSGDPKWAAISGAPPATSATPGNP